MKRVGFLLIVMMIFSSYRDVAAQEYVKPSFDNIVKTLIRMGAVDIHQDEIIDLYARVLYCPQYIASFKDEFVWEKKRYAMRQEIRQDISTYPIGYAYEDVVQLDRYKFEERFYPFVRKEGKEINVNTFSMFVTDKSFCSGDRQSWLPSVYKLVLNKPVKMKGLYLNEEDGRTLLQRMDARGNTDHILFFRANVRVVFVAPFSKPEDVLKRREEAQKQGKAFVGAAVTVVQDLRGEAIRLDGLLDSIDYFEDEARTKLIYTYRPTPFSSEQ